MSKIKVLNSKSILFDIEVEDKFDAILKISNRLFEEGYIKDVVSFTNAVLQREKEGKTGIGYSVAIPHGKSCDVRQTVTGIMKLQRAIEWEAVDSLPVKFIILFAVKSDENDIERLDEMSEIAVSLANTSFIDRLHNARSPEEIVELFQTELDLN